MNGIDRLHDDFSIAAERVFFKKAPYDCLEAEDPDWVKRFELSNVMHVINRLSVLQKEVSLSVGEPVIYHYAHVTKIGSLSLGQTQHINAGIINDPELLIERNRWVSIGSQGSVFSTKVNDGLVQGYSYGDSMPHLLIDNLLNFHVNGDVNESMGFLVGSRAVGQFLDAIGPEQADFIKENLN